MMGVSPRGLKNKTTSQEERAGMVKCNRHHGYISFIYLGERYSLFQIFKLTGPLASFLFLFKCNESNVDLKRTCSG